MNISYGSMLAGPNELSWDYCKCVSQIAFLLLACAALYATLVKQILRFDNEMITLQYTRVTCELTPASEINSIVTLI